MFYIIYKITNKNNGKYYIGMHKTDQLDDGYMGSGKLIRRAIKKYGSENFSKDILHIFDNEDDMKAKEKELVVLNEMSYNLCDGGKGGFGYINKNPNKFLTEKRLNSLMSWNEAQHRWRIKYDGDENFRIETKERSRLALQKARENNPNGTFFGRKHTEKTKQKMSKPKNQGSQNSQYGTCWVTNGLENKKVKKENLDEYLKKGYTKGRIMRD